MANRKKLLSWYTTSVSIWLHFLQRVYSAIWKICVSRVDSAESFWWSISQLHRNFRIERKAGNSELQITSPSKWKLGNIELFLSLDFFCAFILLYLFSSRRNKKRMKIIPTGKKKHSIISFIYRAVPFPSFQLMLWCNASFHLLNFSEMAKRSNESDCAREINFVSFAFPPLQLEMENQKQLIYKCHSRARNSISSSIKLLQSHAKRFE